MPFTVTKPFKHDGQEIPVGTEIPDGMLRNQRSMERTRYIQRIGYTPAPGAVAVEVLQRPVAPTAAESAAAQAAADAPASQTTTDSTQEETHEQHPGPKGGKPRGKFIPRGGTA